MRLASPVHDMPIPSIPGREEILVMRGTPRQRRDGIIYHLREGVKRCQSDVLHLLIYIGGGPVD